MTYYSRSRLSSQDSTSSDLFDEMVESSRISELEPPPLKVKAYQKKPSSKKKSGITYAKVLYDYTHQKMNNASMTSSSPSPTLDAGVRSGQATPTSSLTSSSSSSSPKYFLSPHTNSFDLSGESSSMKPQRKSPRKLNSGSNTSPQYFLSNSQNDSFDGTSSIKLSRKSPRKPQKLKSDSKPGQDSTRVYANSQRDTTSILQDAAEVFLNQEKTSPSRKQPKSVPSKKEQLKIFDFDDSDGDGNEPEVKLSVPSASKGSGIRFSPLTSTTGRGITVPQLVGGQGKGVRRSQVMGSGKRAAAAAAGRSPAKRSKVKGERSKVVKVDISKPALEEDRTSVLASSGSKGEGLSSTNLLGVEAIEHQPTPYPSLARKTRQPYQNNKRGPPRASTDASLAGKEAGETSRLQPNQAKRELFQQTLSFSSTAASKPPPPKSSVNQAVSETTKKLLNRQDASSGLNQDSAKATTIPDNPGALQTAKGQATVSSGGVRFEKKVRGVAEDTVSRGVPRGTASSGVAGAEVLRRSEDLGGVASKGVAGYESSRGVMVKNNTIGHGSRRVRNGTPPPDPYAFDDDITDSPTSAAAMATRLHSKPSLPSARTGSKTGAKSHAGSSSDSGKTPYDFDDITDSPAPSMVRVPSKPPPPPKTGSSIKKKAYSGSSAKPPSGRSYNSAAKPREATPVASEADSGSKPVLSSRADYSSVMRKKRKENTTSPSLSPAKLHPQAASPLLHKHTLRQENQTEVDDSNMLLEIDSLLGEGGGAIGMSRSSSQLSSSSTHYSKTYDHTHVRQPLNLKADDPDVPSLTKSSSWPLSASARMPRPSHGGPAHLGAGGLRVNNQLVTKVQNVREAHQCQESGENNQFFEEAQYLLENINPSQPLHVRSLGTCNLATHYLDIEFSRQLRAHSFTSHVTARLKDAMEHPALCLSAALLFYVITRNKLNNEWDSTGTKLLVGMLSSPEAASGRELSGKAARDMAKITTKVRSILEKVADQTSNGADTPPPEDDDDELPLSQPLNRKEAEPVGSGFRVNTEEISVEELSRECIISLTAPQNNPQWLRDELRVQGALDRLANIVMSSCDELSGLDCSGLGEEPCDYSQSIVRRAEVLNRQLKSIENLTLMNKNNQSYLVIFDGSVLLTKLTQYLKTGHRLLQYRVLRASVQATLLAVLKVLLNVTHESELGSHRVGEQRGVMDNIFRIVLEPPGAIEPGEHFDISILALSLLINMTEHSSTNCKLVEALVIDPTVARQPNSTPSSVPTHSQGSHDLGDEEDCRRHGNHNSSIRALVNLFLDHHAKADSANIEVPTPQRLSQIASSQHSASPSSSSSPQKLGGASGRGMPSRPVSSSSPAKPGRGGGVIKGAEKGEEFEKIELDPLVFDRDEFNNVLDQAGRHMEDSILSSYAALLLGILAEHNHDNVDFIRALMPSGTFSEMKSDLKQYVSFMNIAGSSTGLDSIKHTIKYLEAV